MVIGHQDAVTRRQSPGDGLDSDFEETVSAAAERNRLGLQPPSDQGREPSSSPAGLEHLTFSSVQVQGVLGLASSLLSSSCFHLPSARISDFYHHAGFVSDGGTQGFVQARGALPPESQPQIFDCCVFCFFVFKF